MNFDLELNAAIEDTAVHRNICQGPIWEEIESRLDPEFGIRTVIGVLSHYVFLHRELHEGKVIPRQLSIKEDLVPIIRKAYERKHKDYAYKVKDGSITRIIDNAFSHIYGDIATYNGIIEYIGDRPTWDHLKAVFQETEAPKVAEVDKPIQQAAQNKGISRNNLAKSIGVDKSTLSRIAHGRRAPSIEVAQKMEKAGVRVPISKLKTGDRLVPD